MVSEPLIEFGPFARCARWLQGAETEAKSYVKVRPFEHGPAPLHLAADCGDWAVCLSLLVTPESHVPTSCHGALQDAKASVEVYDETGETPVTKALRK